MHKTLKGLVLAILIVICSFAVSAVAEETVDVYVNGVLLETDQKAMIANGRTLVPLRHICEALNCEVTWDADTQTAQIQNEVTIISVQVNNYYLSKVDRKDETAVRSIELDVPPVVYNDRVLVPARAIAEALYAIVEWDNDNRCVWITLEFDYIAGFNQLGLAEVKKNGKYGYINAGREIVVPVEYDHVGGFFEGYAGVNKNGRWGFVDRFGKVRVPIAYTRIWDFKEGFAVVGKNQKWGHVNTRGEEVVPIIYTLADSFSEGFARVEKDGKWGFVDTEGNVAIPLIYDMAYSFSGGTAKVKKDGSEFYIDYSGTRTEIVETIKEK